PERDPVGRALALFRLAALERRQNPSSVADDAFAREALALLTGDEARSLEALVARVELARPADRPDEDPELAATLALLVGGPDEPVALRLLELLPGDHRELLGARRSELRF